MTVPRTGDISVVIPVFNHARWVAAAVASVLGQTILPSEVIIIDDGSTDGSVEAVADYLHRHPAPAGVDVTVLHRPNRGAHATLNEAFARARGAYVAVLNSDDEYEPDRLEICLAAAKAGDSGFVLTYVEPIGSDGAPLSPDHPWRTWYADGRLHELDVLPTLGFSLLFGNIAVTTGNFFVRRDLAERIGPFRAFRYAHDLDYLLRAVLIEEPILVRRKLYRYRLHDSNTINADQRLVDAECAALYGDFLRAGAAARPSNPIAPTLERFASTLSALPLSPPFAAALDGLIASPHPTVEAAAPSVSKNACSEPPQVLLIGHEFSRTGAPVLLFDIARALTSRGVRPEIVSAKDGPLRIDIEEAGIPATIAASHCEIWSTRLARLARPDLIGGLSASLVARASRLMSRLGESRFAGFGRPKLPERVLVNSSSAFPLAHRLLDRHEGRLVWYIHETLDPELILRSGLDRDRFRELVSRPRSILVFGSDATRRAWARDGFDGEMRYWSGIPRRTDERRPHREGARRVVLSVGTFGPRKGTGDLIEAFASALARGAVPSDVDLCIVGCQAPSLAPYTRDLLRRVWQDDLRGRVRLVESVAPAELEAFYHEVCIYVQASTMECLPLALLTAMSLGLPIVTTDAGGCAEAVRHGESGLVTQPRRAEALADAISLLLAEPDLAQQYGAAAKERFDRTFSLEVTAPPLLDLLLQDEPR
jgi:glycosyltransferase involved in cell wall biosynthesis